MKVIESKTTHKEEKTNTDKEFYKMYKNGHKYCLTSK